MSRCLDVDMDSNQYDRVYVESHAEAKNPSTYRTCEIMPSPLLPLRYAHKLSLFAYKHVQKKKKKHNHLRILENLVLDLFLYGLHVK